MRVWQALWGSNPRPADQKSDAEQNLAITTADSIKTDAVFPVESDATLKI